MVSVGEAGVLSVGVGEVGGSVAPPPVPGADAGGPSDGPWLVVVGEPGAPLVGGADAGAEADGEAEVVVLADGPAEGPPLGPVPAADADGDSEAESPPAPPCAPVPPGVDASCGPGGSVETPGCRIGAMGGCLGRGFGVMPETQA